MTSPDPELAPDVAGEVTVSASAVLPPLVDAMRRLGGQLDVHHVDEDRWTPVLRSLYTVNMLQGCTLVAVAGAQGAGKTTLVRGLYPAAAPWLAPNEGRGERIPVAIVERRDVRQAQGVVIIRQPGSGRLEREVFAADRMAAWEEVVSGRDTRSIMVQVEVPLAQGFWLQDMSGFVLLPGFERLADSDWQQLMRIVLVTSSAAVVVTDENRMANASQTKIMDQLVTDVRTAGVAGGRGVEVLVAVNRCDDKPAEAVASVRRRAAEVYGVAESRVVAFGATPDAPSGWRTRFATGIQDLLPAAVHSRRLEVELLRTIVRREVANVVRLGQQARDRAVLASKEVSDLATMMATFDAQRDQLLGSLTRQLELTLGGHFNKAARAMDEQLRATGGLPEFGRRGLDYVTFDPEGRHDRIAKIVTDAWDSATVQRLHGDCLHVVVQQGLRISGADRATPQDMKPLLEIGTEFGPDPTNLDRAIRMLPVMALATRELLVSSWTDGSPDPDELTRPDSPYWKLVETKAENLDATSRAMLLGVVGLLATVAIESADDATGADAAEVSQGVRNLVEGARAVSAVFGLPAVQASGLSMAWAAPLAGVVAAGVALREGNRAMRDRIVYARAMLSSLHAHALQEARARVEEVLRLTRSMLESRLRVALRLGDAQTRELALVQATRDVERCRAHMLRVLSGSVG